MKIISKVELNDCTQNIYTYDYVLKNKGIYKDISDDANDCVLVTLEYGSNFTTIFISNTCVEPAFNSSWKDKTFIKLPKATLKISVTE